MQLMSAAQRRKIFRLAKEKELDNDLLHSYIHSLTKKSSLKDLTIADAIKVIDNLEGKKQTQPGMRTEAQAWLIEELARELGWVDDENKLDKDKLNSFIEVYFKTSNTKWLTSKKASQVIQGLKAMKERDKACLKI